MTLQVEMIRQSWIVYPYGHFPRGLGLAGERHVPFHVVPDPDLVVFMVPVSEVDVHVFLLVRPRGEDEGAGLLVEREIGQVKLADRAHAHIRLPYELAAVCYRDVHILTIGKWLTNTGRERVVFIDRVRHKGTSGPGTLTI